MMKDYLSSTIPSSKEMPSEIELLVEPRKVLLIGPLTLVTMNNNGTIMTVADLRKSYNNEIY